MTLEGVARRPGEVHVGGLDAAGAGVGGHQPEHGVGTRERPVDDADVAVRPRHDLDTLAHLRGKTGRVTHDHPDRLAAAEDVAQDLAADQAGGRGDDDHVALLND